jgi:predicted DNA-binding protein with PD1-like motif
MQYQKSDKRMVVVLSRGEQIMASLTKLCEAEGIEGGAFYGLGAVDEAELASYDVPNKKYNQQTLTGVFEVTNLTGTIGMMDEQRIVHGHITLADEQMKAWGGHLVEARVSGTMELVITMFERLAKHHDEATGLNIFKFGLD